MKKKRIITISVLVAALLACFIVALVLLVGTGGHRHRFGQWLTVTNASCSSYGTEKRVCRDDDYEETRTFARLGHKFGENNVCTECGYVLHPTEGLVYSLSKDRSYYSVEMGEAQDTDIVIPRYYQGVSDEKPLPVNAISEDGFSPEGGRVNVTSVYIPDGLLSIGARAFKDCSELLSCRMSVTATEIGDFAFENCTSLGRETDTEFGSIEIAPRASIGNFAFSGCISLREVRLPDSAANFGMGTFRGCTSLETVLFVHYEDVGIGEAISTLASAMFEHCSSLKSITLHEKTKTIGSNAFYGCTALRNIYLFSGITRIESTAIPGTVNEINFSGTMRQWRNIVRADDWVYWFSEQYDVKTFIVCKDGKLTHVGNQISG